MKIMRCIDGTHQVKSKGLSEATRYTPRQEDQHVLKTMVLVKSRSVSPLWTDIRN